MREAAAGVHERSEVGDRLDCADFGGHERHGTKRETPVPRGGCFVTGNGRQDRHATRIHGQNLPVKALTGRDLALVGDCVVLKARNDDETATAIAPTHAACRSHHAERVRLRGTGREDHLVDIGPESERNLFARVVEHATGPPPSKVEGGGIARGGSQVTLGTRPRLEGALAQRRGGRVVEIDAHAWERASSMAARAAVTTSVTSPTTPKSAISKIGASGSSHTATMWAADCIPTVW